VFVLWNKKLFSEISIWECSIVIFV